jgi:hypothetical protein
MSTARPDICSRLRMNPEDRVMGLADAGKPTEEFGTVEKTNDDDALVSVTMPGRTSKEFREPGTAFERDLSLRRRPTDTDYVDRILLPGGPVDRFESISRTSQTARTCKSSLCRMACHLPSVQIVTN